MNNLSQTGHFNLLIERSLPTTQQMHQAYDPFVKKVLTLNQTETDFQTIFRTLNITRIEFKTLQRKILCEQGKKCVKKTVLPESNLVSRIRD